MAYSEMLPIMRTSLLCNPAGHGLIVWAVEMDIGAWLASPFSLPIQTETPAPWDGIFSLWFKPLTDIHNGVSPRWFLVSPSEQWRLIITGGTKTFTGWWDHTPLPWRTWDRFPAPVVDALHLLVWPQLLKPSLDLYGHLHMCGIHSHRHAPR